jgi:large subunit ribosomal protein L9
MKIILRQDYEHLGNAGDIKEVKDGYARNFLIPNGIAYIATPSNIKQYNEVRKQQGRKIQKEIENSKTISEKLENIIFDFSMKTSEDDKIFGSVTSQMIHDALSEKGFGQIEKRKIILKEPIKTLGEHLVEIKLHSTVVAKIKVNVVKESEVNPEDVKDEQAITS